MKYLMNNITSLFLVMLLVAVTSCDSVTGDPDLPIPLKETQENTGAFLRIANVNVGAFDISDPGTAVYEIEVEYEDGKDEPLLENVEFYASYTSFVLDPEEEEPVVIEETPEPFFTIPASDFTVDEESGLLSTTVSVPYQDMVDALDGLDASDVETEDQFTLRWTLNLTDGRSFTNTDASPAVSGGFYSSPYRASVSAVEGLPEDRFTGTYEFTVRGNDNDPALEGSPYDPSLFGGTFTAELSVDPDNTLNGRVMEVEPFPLEGNFVLDPIAIPLTFAQTAAVAGGSDGIATGLSCSDGIAVGTAEEDLELIDIEDDSEFMLPVAANVRADCGAGSAVIQYDAVKQ